MKRFIYEGAKTSQISFPLGGIGAGCVGLAGNGRLIDWEIMGRPNKGSYNGLSHIALKAEQDGRVLDARVLNGDLPPPYMGDLSHGHFNQYGFGVARPSMAGMPHFRAATFRAAFPFADIDFSDDTFPGRVTLSAFSPFIPHNDKDSSLPAAFFTVRVSNPTDREIRYTAAFSLGALIQGCMTDSFYSRSGDNHLLAMRPINLKEDDDKAQGSLSLGGKGGEASYQEHWIRSGWFDNIGVFWRDFTSCGPLKNRNYPPDKEKLGGYPGGMDTCTLALSRAVAPGQSADFDFALCWHFPVCRNHWNPPKDEPCGCEGGRCGPGNEWRQYYASLFPDARACALYALQSWDRLMQDTQLFSEALMSSTLPDAALDAVSANISILKSPTCMRLEDGSFYAFEGCHCDTGCCEGSCTHVWNYAYALPYLFPQLERSMRELDFTHNMDEHGGMRFRLQLPLGRRFSAFRPCADGQFGGVIKTYREWLISGDDQWLAKWWPCVKQNIEYAWSPENPDRWDLNKDGVMEGRQHHTLDMELFGPNSWLNGFYLAALKAGALMAERMGESDTAREYLALFEKGKKWTDEHLFNGSYYHQIVDLKDRSILEAYLNTNETSHQRDVIGTYWNDEAGEIKYQIGEGSGVDQVLAQWHANLCGLGEIHDNAQVKSALRAIYTHNYKRGMRNYYNPCRVYCLNDESGVVICDWPEGSYKPVSPVPYSEETMYGFEYQAAIHMIQEGMITEGMQIVSSLRERFDGERRNPWNEFECGSNYARSMASYALLNAFSGFSYNMSDGYIGFAPVQTGDFSCFWALGSAWGVYKRAGGRAEIQVLRGSLTINRAACGCPASRVSLSGKTLPFTAANDSLTLAQPALVGAGDSLIFD